MHATCQAFSGRISQCTWSMCESLHQRRGTTSQNLQLSLDGLQPTALRPVESALRGFAATVEQAFESSKLNLRTFEPSNPRTLEPSNLRTLEPLFVPVLVQRRPLAAVTCRPDPLMGAAGALATRVERVPDGATSLEGRFRCTGNFAAPSACSRGLPVAERASDAGSALVGGLPEHRLDVTV